MDDIDWQEKASRVTFQSMYKRPADVAATLDFPAVVEPVDVNEYPPADLMNSFHLFKTFSY